MKALIVDDSRFLRSWMRRELGALGFCCEEAEHGGVALNTLSSGARFDLMLVDANMPHVSGLHCLEALGELRLEGSMRVMMVTSEADDAFMLRALELGADEFMMKPVTGEGLRSKLSLLGLVSR